MQHKRGDSISWLAPIPEIFADGYFVGYEVSSQIRTAQYGQLIANLICEWVDPATTRELLLTCLDTKSFPVGEAENDIQFTRISDGFVQSSDTLLISIVRDVTKDE